jgi:hypothetical protein
MLNTELVIAKIQKQNFHLPLLTKARAIWLSIKLFVFVLH